MLRLVPFVEKNFNSVELGTRGTGKSFVYQQLSPYCHLVSGGQTTTAQMFVNLASGQRGLVCLWDVVAFDEAAGVRFSDRSGLNIMKGYMEDGTFSRGRVINAEGSVVFVGNIDGDIETIVRTSNLFYPLPKDDGHGVLRPHPCLHPRLGVPEDVGRRLHQPLRRGQRLPRRGLSRAAQAELRRLRRAPLQLRQPSRRPRPEGGAQDRLRARQAAAPARRGQPGRGRGVPRLRAGDAQARQGAAQEDGRAGVLGHEFLLHRQGERPGDLRPRARERRRG